MNENIYISLDEAREELKKRWNDKELKKKIEDELGENFWPEFQSKPRGLLWRQLLSPDNGFTFFYQCSKYIGVEPLAFEFLGDLYMSFNEEKRGLGQLRIELEDGKKATVNIMEIHKWYKTPLSEVTLKSGEKLVDFHHNLINYSGYDIEVKDMTEWVKKIGKPVDVYYQYLLHFVAHGFLFEAFLAEEKEKNFFSDVVAPNLKKIEDKFSLKPLLVKQYPNNQSDDEDFYWWSYPPNVNRYVLRYAEKNSLTFKNI